MTGCLQVSPELLRRLVISTSGPTLEPSGFAWAVSCRIGAVSGHGTGATFVPMSVGSRAEGSGSACGVESSLGSSTRVWVTVFTDSAVLSSIFSSGFGTNLKMALWAQDQDLAPISVGECQLQLSTEFEELAWWFGPLDLGIELGDLSRSSYVALLQNLGSKVLTCSPA